MQLILRVTLAETGFLTGIPLTIAEYSLFRAGFSHCHLIDSTHFIALPYPVFATFIGRITEAESAGRCLPRNTLRNWPLNYEPDLAMASAFADHTPFSDRPSGSPLLDGFGN